MCETKDTVVLIIDDCQDNLFLMELILMEEGYKVEKASCGKEGVRKIHQIVPDLIILDLMMPDITGFEVIEEIRPYQHLSNIPILLCTANRFVPQNEITRVKNICYKPIDVSKIIMQVHSLITC